jgi:hypothetical protein
MSNSSLLTIGSLMKGVTPACAMPGEGIMSPTNGRIFAYMLSQSVVQCTTAYFSSRYLAKYVAGIDEGNVIYVAPGGKQNITLELVLHSDFIMLQRSLAQKLISKRDRNSQNILSIWMDKL